MPLARGLPFQHLIVQHRSALVEGNNGVVRQLLLALAAGVHEGQRYLEFAASLAEGIRSREMTAHPESIGLTHAVQLVRRFCGAAVVEARDQVAWVDAPKAPEPELRKRLADIGCLAEVLRQK